MDAAETLTFDILVQGEKGVAGLQAVSKGASETAARIEQANIKIAKSTLAVTSAEKKYGVDSLEAREATNKLALAQVNLEKSMSKTAVQTEESGEKLGKFEAIAALAGTVAVEAVIEFGKKSVEAFEESEEAQDRLNDAFEKFPLLADTNVEALKKLNDAQAQKTKFDVDANAVAEATLAQFKLTGTQITQLLPLVDDYAAKTGKTAPDAANALGKALLGQGRALKDIGIQFTDTGTVAGNFTELQAQLNAQVGGFAFDEGKSAAGQAAILHNQFVEIEKTVGGELLPVMLKFEAALLGTAKFIENNSKVITPLVAVLGTVATAILAVETASKAIEITSDAYEKLSTAIEGTQEWLEKVQVQLEGEAVAAEEAAEETTKLDVALDALGKAGVVVTVAAIAAQLSKYNAQVDTSTVQTGALTTSLSDFSDSGKLGTAGLELFSNGLGPFKHNAADSSAALKQFGVEAENALGDKAISKFNRFTSIGGDVATFTKVTTQLDGSLANLVKSGHADQATKSFTAFADAAEADGVPLAKLEAAFPQYTSAIKKAGAQTVLGSAAAQVLQVGLDAQSHSADNATKSLKTLNDETKTYATEALQASGDAIAFQAAIDQASSSIKQNGKDLDITTEKGRANRTALNSIASAGLALAADTPKGSNAQTYFAKTIDETRAKLVTAARQMGDTKAQAQKLASSILGVPKSHATKITTPGSATAENVVQRLRQDVAKVPRIIDVGIRITTTGKIPTIGGSQLRASGGPVSARKTYIVGDGGKPELFVPKTDGMILPEVPKTGSPKAFGASPAARGSGTGGGSASVVLTIQASSDSYSQFLATELKKYVRVSGGGSVQVALGRN